MQHECPMCGCSFNLRCTQRADLLPYWVLIGTDVIFADGVSVSMTPELTALQKVVPLSQWQKYLLDRYHERKKALSQAGSSNGMANQLPRSRRRSSGRRNVLASKA